MIQTWLTLQALFELVRYDLVNAVYGFRGVHGSLSRLAVRKSREGQEFEAACRDAVSYATSLYYKPIRCLQRSVVMARLLRYHGIDARVTIGYRPVPFLSHAWVEIGGRVANDSPTFKQRLHILERI
jgi:hypothetical protein